MKLEDLKQKATTSEMALIDTVERLVRSDYDEEKIRAEIHKKLRNEIENAIFEVIRHHHDNLLFNDKWPSGADYRLKDILSSIGKAISLETTEE